jgi:hypothetical protein
MSEPALESLPKLSRLLVGREGWDPCCREQWSWRVALSLTTVAQSVNSPPAKPQTPQGWVALTERAAGVCCWGSVGCRIGLQASVLPQLLPQSRGNGWFQFQSWLEFGDLGRKKPGFFLFRLWVLECMDWVFSSSFLDSWCAEPLSPLPVWIGNP